MPARVVESAPVEAGPVLQEALAVVEGGPGLGVEAARDDHNLGHLDTAGLPGAW